MTNTAGGRFAIHASTGVLTVANGSLLNYESASSHSVTVRVTDRGGLTYDEAFTISVTNVNQMPAWLVGGSVSLQKTTIPTEGQLLQSDGSRPLSVEIVESKTAAHPAYSQEEIGNGIPQDGTRSDVSKEPPPFSPAQIIALTRFLDEMAYSEGPAPIGEILDRHIDEVKQLLQNMEDAEPPDSEVSRGQLDQIPTVLSAWLIANGINLVPTRKPLVRARQPEGDGPQRY
ncbi:MAG: cadherin repeat domain-containing protein [Nitrospira sp. CG24A]|nr:MAG: cadherin repeat domain-containing protein [Nitrospira sp. CG24A]